MHPLSAQLAQHFRAVYFGGNWSFSCLKEHVEGSSWQLATTALHDLNTIATLVYHLHYYVRAVTRVLEGGPLDAKDVYSFDCPPIRSQAEWDALLQSIWQEGEHFAALVEALPDALLSTTFTDEKYGSYYRNIHGIVEHAHYHLGQIVLIKKLLAAQANLPEGRFERENVPPAK